MSDYRYFRKVNPGWPRLIRDVVGRQVRIKHKIETRGGTVFEAGEELRVYHTYRGRLCLTNDQPHPETRQVTRVHPREVELLRPRSIIWRNKEAFLLFCVSVAGKQSRPTQARVEAFLETVAGAPGEEDTSPFLYIRNLINGRNLLKELKRLRFGQYKKLLRAFTELATSDLDLDRCKVRDLEKIHGIGPKTSRYFIMRTRPNARVAALDTHVLHWLRDQGYMSVPTSTPQAGKRYFEIESLFLTEAKKRRVLPARLDAEIWERYSRFGMTSGERDVADEVASFE